MEPDHLGGFLFLLDTDVLDQVLQRLSPEDVARLSCTSRHLRSQISTGRRALQLWLTHCKELLGDLSVAQVTASCRADTASTWQQLYASARMLDRLHWSPSIPAASALKVVADHSSDNNTQQQQQQQLLHQLLPSPVSDAASLLARTHHTATAASTHLVIIGGDVRDGPAPTAADVVVLDLPNRRVLQPRLHGKQPPSLRHHCTVLLKPRQDSVLFDQVAAAIGGALKGGQQSASSHSSSTAAGAVPSQQQQQHHHLAATGHILAVFGGLLPDGCEQSPEQQQLHVLWLHPDGSWGVWLHPSASGAAPAPRAYSCCAAIRDSTQLLVYGGWVHGSHTGTVQSDVGVFDGYLLLCVYVFDCASLTWSQVPTKPLNEAPRPGHTMIGPSTCPGPRKQALSCTRTNPATGREEFVVLGGCGADGLADFVPYSLNLETFCWTKGPATGYLPAARGLCSVAHITPSWLLLLGGQGPTKQQLGDIERLHLPTLSWKPPVLVAGGSTTGSSSQTATPAAAAAAAACQAGATQAQQQQALLPACCPSVGCSTAAGVVLGGVLEGPYGSSIVPRLQMLLPGPVILAVEGQQQPQGNSLFGTAAVPAGFTVLSQGLLTGGSQQQADEQQHPQQPTWHAYTTSGCRCGSCCGCLAAKALASGGAPPPCAAPTPNGHSPGGGARAQQPCQGGASASLCAQGCGSGGGGGTPPIKPGDGQQGCGSRWSGELEIEPAPGSIGYTATPHKGGVAASQCVTQSGVCYTSTTTTNQWQPQGGGGDAAGGLERVWQQSVESSQEGWVLQMALAVCVVLLGLVLMAPSLMMHQQT